VEHEYARRIREHRLRRRRQLHHRRLRITLTVTDSAGQSDSETLFMSLVDQHPD
jgi:hypothetical protein